MESELAKCDDLRKSSIWVYLSTFSALLGCVCMGSTIGWTATAFPDMNREDSEPRLSISDDDRITKSWIASSVNLGALIGGLLCGFLLQNFGRKKSLIIAGIIFTFGWLFILTAKSVAMIIIGRIITGFCCGLMCGIVPIYISEISTPDIRGLLGTGFNSFIVLGILNMSIFGLILSWNSIAIVALIPSALMVVLMTFMPDSPVWLSTRSAQSGQIEKAIVKLRKPNSNIESELKELKECALKARNDLQFSLSHLKREDVYRPLLLAISLIFFLQFSGVNAILFYATDIIREAGSSIAPNISLIIINITTVVATIPGSLLVDRVGRKILLILSGLGQALSLATLGYYYFAKPLTVDLIGGNSLTTRAFNQTIVDRHDSSLFVSDWGWMPVACLAVYVLSFSVGYGPIPWIVISEVSPSFAIGFISSAASASNWLFAFYMTNQFELIKELVTIHGAFWLLAVINAAGVAFVAVSLPETKGKSLEQIQRLLRRDNSAVDVLKKDVPQFYDSSNFTKL